MAIIMEIDANILFHKTGCPCTAASQCCRTLRIYELTPYPATLFRGDLCTSQSGPTCLLWQNGWMDQDTTWYRGRPRPSRHRFWWGPSSSATGRVTAAPTFRPMSIVAKRSPISGSQQLLNSCQLSENPRWRLLQSGIFQNYVFYEMSPLDWPTLVSNDIPDISHTVEMHL